MSSSPTRSIHDPIAEPFSWSWGRTQAGGEPFDRSSFLENYGLLFSHPSPPSSTLLSIPSFYYHSSFTSSSLLFRRMAARYIAPQVYFICNAKEKLTIVLNFLGIRKILFSQEVVQFQATENNSVLKLLTQLRTICGKSRRRRRFIYWIPSILLHRFFYSDVSYYDCINRKLDKVSFLMNLSDDSWISTANKNNFTPKLFINRKKLSTRNLHWYCFQWRRYVTQDQSWLRVSVPRFKNWNCIESVTRAS